MSPPAHRSHSSWSPRPSTTTTTVIIFNLDDLWPDRGFIAYQCLESLFDSSLIHFDPVLYQIITLVFAPTANSLISP